jgi:hypothetical protein
MTVRLPALSLQMEFVFALIAMWGPISLVVLNGVMNAIGATLAYLLRQVIFPHDSMAPRMRCVPLEARSGWMARILE